MRPALGAVKLRRPIVKPPLDNSAFALDPNLVWLAHCAEGPVPWKASHAVEAFLDRERRPWALRWKEEFLGLPGRVKGSTARLAGCTPEDVTLTATTSSALATVAQGWPWRPDDEVVLPLGEFPSNIWPWKALAARGVRLREVSLWEGQRAGAEAGEGRPPELDDDPESRLAEAIGAQTRIVSVSWVRFQDGLKLDPARLARACRDRGAVLCVDGIQGLGTSPCDMGAWQADALATGGHKGLLAPQGLGVLVTAPAMRERLLPTGSWLSVEQGTDFSRPSTDHERAWLDTGERFEQGVPNLVGCAALAESLELIERAGVAAIAAHIAELQRRLIEALSRTDVWAAEAERLERLRAAGRIGAILSLHHRGRGEAWLEELRKAGAGRGLYASVREGYLRIAFHGWHDEDDLQRVVEWLASA
jgi:selenocysteine lyase/cysteine desulfurase